MYRFVCFTSLYLKFRIFSSKTNTLENHWFLDEKIGLLHEGRSTRISVGRCEINWWKTLKEWENIVFLWKNFYVPWNTWNNNTVLGNTIPIQFPFTFLSRDFWRFVKCLFIRCFPESMPIGDLSRKKIRPPLIRDPHRSPCPGSLGSL